MREACSTNLLNTHHYITNINNILHKIKDNTIIISDIDGVIINDETYNLKMLEYYNNIKFKNILFITGREVISNEIKKRILRCLPNKNIYYICNEENITKSSRILKNFVFTYLNMLKVSYIYYEDRKDVLKYIGLWKNAQQLYENIYVVNKVIITYEDS